MHRQRHTRHSVAQMMMMIVNINRIHLHLTSKMWIRSCSRVFISAVRTAFIELPHKTCEILIIIFSQVEIICGKCCVPKKKTLYQLMQFGMFVPVCHYFVRHMFASFYRISIDMQLFHCSIFKFWITTWANALCVCVVYVCDTTFGCATANADNFVAI